MYVDNGQGVEGLEAVVGERVVVHQQPPGAGEERPAAGHVEVVQRLRGVGLDLNDPHQAAEAAQDVTRLELAGHGPTEVGAPEAVVDAAHHRVATRERDAEGLAGWVMVEEDDGLEGECSGGGVLGEDLVADLDGLDGAGSGEGVDRRPGGEAGRDPGGGEHWRWRSGRW